MLKTPSLVAALGIAELVKQRQAAPGAPWATSLVYLGSTTPAREGAFYLKKKKSHGTQ